MAAALPSPDQKHSNWLSSFAGEEATQKDLKRGYTAFVKFLQLALPVAALAIVAILVFRLAGKDPYEPVAIKDLPMPTQAEAVMVDAKYEGVDAESRPYTITADQVSRSLDNPDLMNMVQPMADITLSDGTWLAAQAKAGTYQQKAGKISLQGLVRLFHDAGYEMRTEELDIDMTAGKAWSETPVQGQGPKGTIKSTGTLVEDSGAYIVFTGPVTLNLFNLGDDE